MNYYPTYVPDSGPLDAKILFVGEAPGESEVEAKTPFIGAAGEKLVQCLNMAGLSRDEVRLANLCHYRPYGNRFEALLSEQVLKDGIKELYSHIALHRPNVIVPLGNWPLHYITGLARFNNKKQISGISKWRGSILPSLLDPLLKVIPTFHPSYVTRNAQAFPTFAVDINKIVTDSAYPDKRYRQRRYITNPQGLEIEEWTEKLCNSEYLACDIETIRNSQKILCVGFAPSPEIAVCFVPSDFRQKLAIERILTSPAKKIFQFGAFDTLQLELNEYTIRDPEAEKLEQLYWWDVFQAQQILAPELPRSLEYLTSIYTREPYYKQMGRANIPDDNKAWSEETEKGELYTYNCKDCCCTYEIFEQQQAEIAAHRSKEIFHFQMRSLGVANDISSAGMLIDQDRRLMLTNFLLSKWGRKQVGLDGLVGREVNVNSNPVVQKILYDKEYLGLPIRRSHDGHVTADEDAIVSLISFCKDKLLSSVRPDTKQKWTEQLAICKVILEIRGIRKMLSSYLRAKISDDGRIRSTYKVGGTETGRWAASKFVDGNGWNGMTLPRDPVEVPDEVFEAALKLAEQIQDEDEDGDTNDD